MSDGTAGCERVMPRVTDSNVPEATAQECADLGMKVHEALQEYRDGLVGVLHVPLTRCELETLLIVLEQPRSVP